LLEDARRINGIGTSLFLREWVPKRYASEPGETRDVADFACPHERVDLDYSPALF